MSNGRFRTMLAHHRSPYKQAFVVAVLVLIAVFVFFPPFEFKPYTLLAEELEVIDVPERVEIPPPPEDVPPPVPTPEPADDGESTTDEVPETMFAGPDFPPPPPPNTGSRTGFIAFDELPVLEYLAELVYPPLAREAGIEGTVYLTVLIGLDHRVHEAVVLSSDVTPAMEKAALKAALKCRYKPAKQRTVEVEVWVPILITFKLN